MKRLFEISMLDIFVYPQELEIQLVVATGKV